MPWFRGKNGYHHGNRLPTTEDLEESVEVTPRRFFEIAQKAGWSDDKIADAVDQCLLSSWPIELGGQTYLIVNSSILNPK